MSDKPPLLPVLVGVGTIGLGLVNGLFFSIGEGNLLLAPSEPGPSIASLGPGLLGLMDAFSILLVPAGIGILLHRPWGKQLAQGLASGMTVMGLLGSVPKVVGLASPGVVVSGLFGWGFLTGLSWAIALNVAYRSRSMEIPFGEAASRDHPAVTPP